MIAEVPFPGADLLLHLAAMHLTFFHVDPKRCEQPKRKPKRKNQSRDDQPASPFVSEKGRDGGHNADYQEQGAEHDVGTAQRIRFAGAAQRACDSEDTHHTVGAGSEAQNDLEDLPDHDRRFINP